MISNKLTAYLYVSAAVVNVLRAFGGDNIALHLIIAFFAATLAYRYFDDAKIDGFERFTRTWHNGELIEEHRVDAEGQQSGTFYGHDR